MTAHRLAARAGGAAEVRNRANVMIYFDAPTRPELGLKLIERLAPGGYFVPGYSAGLRGSKHPLKTLKPGIYRKD